MMSTRCLNLARMRFKAPTLSHCVDVQAVWNSHSRSDVVVSSFVRYSVGSSMRHAVAFWHCRSLVVVGPAIWNCRYHTQSLMAVQRRSDVGPAGRDSHCPAVLENAALLC